MTPVMPLKRIAELRVERRRNDADGILTLDLVEGGNGRLLIDPWEAPTVPADTGVADVTPGDVLFGKLRPYLAKVVHVERPGYASTELMCLRPRAKIDSRWFFYRMIAQPTVEWSVATSEGTKMPRTSWERLGEFRVEVPEQRVQRVIADYLDTETARIDALVAKKQQLLSRLGERAMSAVDDALAGSGPDSPLRYVVRYREGPGIMAADFRDSGTPLLRIGNLVGGKVELAGCNFVDPQVATARWRQFKVKSGDYILSGSATMGMVSVVEDEAVVGAIPYTGLIILRPASPETHMPFVAAFLRSSLFFDQIDRMRTGMGLQHFGPSHLSQIRMPFPSRERQVELVGRLAAMDAKVTGAARRLERQLSLLKEHRQALITAAVTGELEIPGVA